MLTDRRRMFPLCSILSVHQCCAAILCAIFWQADACNDAENAADVDQVDDGMLVKDNDAPAAASTVPVTSEDPVRESKLDVERPTEHVAMPSADSTPPATRDICEMETDVDSDSLVKQDATSAEVTTTQAICEGTRPDEGEADSEDASTPAAKNDTSTTCKRRRDEHVSLPVNNYSARFRHEHVRLLSKGIFRQKCFSSIHDNILSSHERVLASNNTNTLLGGPTV